MGKFICVCAPGFIGKVCEKGNFSFDPECLGFPMDVQVKLLEDILMQQKPFKFEFHPPLSLYLTEKGITLKLQRIEAS